LADDPYALSLFTATLGCTKLGKQLVSAKEEAQIASDITDPESRTLAQLRVAQDRSDLTLYQRAMDSFEQVPDAMQRRMLAGAVVRLAYPHGMRLAKHHVVPVLQPGHPAGDSFVLQDLIVRLSRAGAPAEALPLLDKYGPGDDIYSGASAAVVRALAAQGSEYYMQAVNASERLKDMDCFDPYVLDAGLLVGSAPYRTHEDVRRGADALGENSLRSEALCEIALATRNPCYLADAMPDWRQWRDRPTYPLLPNNWLVPAVRASIHVMDTYRGMVCQ
jgi:hypothetical protein